MSFNQTYYGRMTLGTGHNAGADIFYIDQLLVRTSCHSDNIIILLVLYPAVSTLHDRQRASLR